MVRQQLVLEGPAAMCHWYFYCRWGGRVHLGLGAMPPGLLSHRWSHYKFKLCHLALMLQYQFPIERTGALHLRALVTGFTALTNVPFSTPTTCAPPREEITRDERRGARRRTLNADPDTQVDVNPSLSVHLFLPNSRTLSSSFYALLSFHLILFFIYFASNQRP